jgi:hypothetical protein
MPREHYTSQVLVHLPNYRLAGLVVVTFPKGLSEQVQVHPQSNNNLVDHVKRNTSFPHDSTYGAQWDQKQKAYTATYEYNDYSGTSQISTPVEFITNTEDGQDNWYRLISRQTEHGVTYFTSQEQILGSNHGLGWWDKFDSRHPDFVKSKGKKKASPTEEILSGGLYHIATTSGISPLTPEGPTGTLQAITHAAAQGQPIDTTGTPAEAMAGINTTTTNMPSAQTTA